MSDRYWEVRFKLPGGWDLIHRLITDDMVDASEQSRSSLKKHNINIDDIDRICAECTELDMTTGDRKVGPGRMYYVVELQSDQFRLWLDSASKGKEEQHERSE